MTVACVDRLELVAALDRLKKIAGRPTAEKPARLISLASRATRLVVEAGNDEEHLTCNVSAAVFGAPSAITVSIEPLLAMLKTSDTTTVDVSIGDELVVTAGSTTAHVRSRDGEVPKVPRTRGTKIPLTAYLREAILRAVKHCSTDAARPVLTRVAFDGSSVVGSDSFTLAVTSGLRPAGHVTVPAKPLALAVKDAADGAYIVIGTKSIKVADRTSATTINIDPPVGYPRWQKMMRQTPGAKTTTVEFDRKAMLAAVRDALTVGSDVMLAQDDYARARSVLHVTGRLNGSNVIAHEVQATLGKLPHPMVFNPQYLKRALESQTSDKVRMVAEKGKAQALQPVRLIDGFSTVLVMPVRSAG